MAIPKIEKKNIEEALKYIDENGVPFKNQGTEYELLSEEGKTYPPKYVIAVADYLANGGEISTSGFNAVEAKNYLEGKEYVVQTIGTAKYELIITAGKVESNDEEFTMDDISRGDYCKPIDTYYKDAAGNVIKRKYEKGEHRICNQTMAKIAFQIFEDDISRLSPSEREAFPVCKYKGNKLICGIFTSLEEYKKERNRDSFENLVYTRAVGGQFVTYTWNIFSTIIFVQECLKRFDKTGGQFVLTYREKTPEELKKDKAEAATETVEVRTTKEYKNEFSKIVIESKNLIFHGAPGTGKSYLAREIAADIISNGAEIKYEALSEEQKLQVEFVQFHPSYDYSDFVEGLRPKTNEDGSIGFELRDGIFKQFIERAKINYENSQKTVAEIEKDLSVQDTLKAFFDDVEFGVTKFNTLRGSEFTITNVDDRHIYIFVPGNPLTDKVTLDINEIKRMLESGQDFKKVKDVKEFFGKNFATQEYSYDFVLYQEIKKKKASKSKRKVSAEELKKYIFIIDEINRGEISKIFGELFFAIDPGYRGKSGEVSTQYVNMHQDPSEKLYVPENVYIIGTMNDIDRSVDSFDFAMRRRFRFIELKADEQLEMLSMLEDEDLKQEAIKRMAALNKEIASVEDLNENYQIGASYYLKLKEIDFNQLWTDYLYPLLKEYIQGMYDEDGIMKCFAKAYGYSEPSAEAFDATD